MASQNGRSTGAPQRNLRRQSLFAWLGQGPRPTPRVRDGLSDHARLTELFNRHFDSRRDMSDDALEDELERCVCEATAASAELRQLGSAEMGVLSNIVAEQNDFRLNPPSADDAGPRLKDHGIATLTPARRSSTPRVTPRVRDNMFALPAPLPIHMLTRAVGQMSHWLLVTDPFDDDDNAVMDEMRNVCAQAGGVSLDFVPLDYLAVYSTELLINFLQHIEEFPDESEVMRSLRHGPREDVPLGYLDASEGLTEEKTVLICENQNLTIQLYTSPAVTILRRWAHALGIYFLLLDRQRYMKASVDGWRQRRAVAANNGRKPMVLDAENSVACQTAEEDESHSKDKARVGDLVIALEAARRELVDVARQRNLIQAELVHHLGKSAKPEWPNVPTSTPPTEAPTTKKSHTVKEKKEPTSVKEKAPKYRRGSVAPSAPDPQRNAEKAARLRRELRLLEHPRPDGPGAAALRDARTKHDAEKRERAQEIIQLLDEERRCEELDIAASAREVDHAREDLTAAQEREAAAVVALEAAGQEDAGAAQAAADEARQCTQGAAARLEQAESVLAREKEKSKRHRLRDELAAVQEELRPQPEPEAVGDDTERDELMRRASSCRGRLRLHDEEVRRRGVGAAARAAVMRDHMKDDQFAPIVESDTAVDDAACATEAAVSELRQALDQLAEVRNVAPSKSHAADVKERITELSTGRAADTARDAAERADIAQELRRLSSGRDANQTRVAQLRRSLKRRDDVEDRAQARDQLGCCVLEGCVAPGTTAVRDRRLADAIRSAEEAQQQLSRHRFEEGEELARCQQALHQCDADAEPKQQRQFQRASERSEIGAEEDELAALRHERALVAAGRAGFLPSKDEPARDTGRRDDHIAALERKTGDRLATAAAKTRTRLTAARYYAQSTNSQDAAEAAKKLRAELTRDRALLKKHFDDAELNTLLVSEVLRRCSDLPSESDGEAAAQDAVSAVSQAQTELQQALARSEAMHRPDGCPPFDSAFAKRALQESQEALRGAPMQLELIGLRAQQVEAATTGATEAAEDEDDASSAQRRMLAARVAAVERDISDGCLDSSEGAVPKLWAELAALDAAISKIDAATEPPPTREASPQPEGAQSERLAELRAELSKVMKQDAVDRRAAEAQLARLQEEDAASPVPQHGASIAALKADLARDEQRRELQAERSALSSTDPAFIGARAAFVRRQLEALEAESKSADGRVGRRVSVLPGGIVGFVATDAGYDSSPRPELSGRGLDTSVSLFAFNPAQQDSVWLTVERLHGLDAEGTSTVELFYPSDAVEPLMTTEVPNACATGGAVEAHFEPLPGLDAPDRHVRIRCQPQVPGAAPQEWSGSVVVTEPQLVQVPLGDGVKADCIVRRVGAAQRDSVPLELQSLPVTATRTAEARYRRQAWTVAPVEDGSSDSSDSDSADASGSSSSSSDGDSNVDVDEHEEADSTDLVAAKMKLDDVFAARQEVQTALVQVKALNDEISQLRAASPSPPREEPTEAAPTTSQDDERVAAMQVELAALAREKEALHATHAEELARERIAAEEERAREIDSRAQRLQLENAEREATHTTSSSTAALLVDEAEKRVLVVAEERGDLLDHLADWGRSKERCVAAILTSEQDTVKSLRAQATFAADEAQRQTTMRQEGAVREQQLRHRADAMEEQTRQLVSQLEARDRAHRRLVEERETSVNVVTRQARIAALNEMERAEATARFDVVAAAEQQHRLALHERFAADTELTAARETLDADFNARLLAATEAHRQEKRALQERIHMFEGTARQAEDEADRLRRDAVSNKERADQRDRRVQRLELALAEARRRDMADGLLQEARRREKAARSQQNSLLEEARLCRAARESATEAVRAAPPRTEARSESPTGWRSEYTVATLSNASEVRPRASSKLDETLGVSRDKKPSHVDIGPMAHGDGDHAPPPRWLPEHERADRVRQTQEEIARLRADGAQRNAPQIAELEKRLAALQHPAAVEDPWAFANNVQKL